MSFWQKIKKPIVVLAPMADVTDSAFRRMIAKYSRPSGPDVFWTEFVSADGLVRASEEGKKKLLKDLEFSEGERPIVAQLFSGNPEYMKQASKLCKDLGFDGIDINMGCPDKGIERQGAGASMIKNPENALEVLKSAQEGAEGLPVSVKTRIGYNKNEIETWIPTLLSANPAVITIHARTRKEMSKVPARWEHVKRAVEIRDELKSETLIFGNGDILNVKDALEKVKESGADGAMLGRAIFGTPWLFSNLSKLKDGEDLGNSEPTVKEKLLILIEHTKLFEELLGGLKNFAVMKKHFKAYITGFDGAGDLRDSLMKTESSKEVEEVVNDWLKVVDNS